jgi:AraC-like DNA-binding protein
MTDLIRSACLTHFAEVARTAGIDPKAMLRRARLPLSCLDHQDMRIAVSGVRRLLEASAAAAGIDEFGLLMAERGGLSNLGPVALIVREQATVGTAIEALARYIHIHHDAMRLRIEHHSDVVTIALFLRGRLPRAQRQSTEMALGSVHRIIRSLFNADWRPLDVHFMHAPPRNRRYYRNFFGCNVTFDSDCDAIFCTADDMEHVIPTAHPLIARYLQSRVAAFDNRPESWDDKVSELVRSLLPSGNCTIERVAEYLACSRRTIHRNLLDCGTSFSAILDAQRADLVTRLIEDRNRSLAETAELLGFSAQSAMARWFRGRFGSSITQWRDGIRPKTLAAGPTRGVLSRNRAVKNLKRPPVSNRRLGKLAR